MHLFSHLDNIHVLRYICGTGPFYIYNAICMGICCTKYVTRCSLATRQCYVNCKGAWPTGAAGKNGIMALDLYSDTSYNIYNYERDYIMVKFCLFGF